MTCDVRIAGHESVTISLKHGYKSYLGIGLFAPFDGVDVVQTSGDPYYNEWVNSIIYTEGENGYSSKLNAAIVLKKATELALKAIAGLRKQVSLLTLYDSVEE